MKNDALRKSSGPRTVGNLRLVFPMLIAVVVILGGCTMNETQQRTASGAGIGAASGAALGAIVGAFAGSPGAGAAIGAWQRVHFSSINAFLEGVATTSADNTARQ